MAAMKPEKSLSPKKRKQAQFHFQQAMHFHQQRQFDAALDSYGKAIALNPHAAQSYANRGNLYGQSGENERALADLNRAIELNPDFADAYANRGALYMVAYAHEREQALADLNRAIALNPAIAEAYANRGNLYGQSGENERALADLSRAIELKPDFAEAYASRGLLYGEFDEYELALADLDRAITLKPDFANAYNFRGVVLIGMKHFKAALEDLEKALRLTPSSAMIYNNIGLAFMGNAQPDIAMEYYEKALELNPGLAEVYCNYANALLCLKQFHAAMEWYDKAIARDPDCDLAYYDKAFPLLVLGCLEEGFALYEYRFRIPSLKLKKMEVPGKRWLGEAPVKGKTLLLCHDEGFGDTIQFCRYARLLSERGAKVLLQVSPALARLLESLEGVDEIIAHEEELTLQTLDKFPTFDLYCPLMGLPLAFQTRLDTIPGKVPYLFVDPEKVAFWENRLEKKTKPRVGLVWSGSAKHTNDHNRSIMLSQWLPYLPDNCEYISLQKDIRDIDKVIFAALPEWKHYEDELNDFSDTAALCTLMDVVVSVDTSVAHLSGALGMPTWVMLPFSPDWRWLLDRRDSPWYPGMRLYRQSERGNWNGVFEEVRNDLLGLGGSGPA